MLPIVGTDSTLILAHVLFLDIVGYSMLPLDEQTRVLRDLRRIVTGSPTFQAACTQQSVITLPSGDGMALAFLSSPECPVKCALEISKGIRETANLKLRMGVHSGPVYRVQDIKGENIVAGSGINMAQRVMDCGDAGHILLSRTVAEVLKETTEWAKRISELGELEVKHGVKLHIFNLSVGEDGNVAIPQKLQRSTARGPMVMGKEHPEVGTSVTKLLELAQADARYLDELESLRELIVVMFTDIQVSTAYFQQHGDAAGLLMMHSSARTIRQVVEKHGGRVIKTIGDGLMATFTRPIASVNAAIEIQKLLGEVNELRAEHERVAVRVGIHLGTGIVKSDDVFGDVVNIASRVEVQATPGQIVISPALFEQLRGSRFNIKELGRFNLKGVDCEQCLYQVIWAAAKEPPALASPPSSVETGKRTSQFRIQLIKHDGSLGPQHPVMPQLTIGRSQGDLRFATDVNMAALNARVFVQDGQLLVEDLSDGREKVFFRVAGGHTLQTGDVIIMGEQVFLFRELAEAMTALTQLGASLDDIHNVLENPVAELARVEPNGQTSEEFPIRWVETRFGRTQGNYTFPKDKIMSRMHASILQRGEDFLLKDAGSLNGTFVNVRSKTRLVDGSAIRVGTQLFRVLCSSG